MVCVYQGATQLNLQYLAVGVEVWNLKGWTNWTETNPDANNAIDWMNSVRDTYLRNKVYFDDIILIR